MNMILNFNKKIFKRINREMINITLNETFSKINKKLIHKNIKK